MLAREEMINDKTAYTERHSKNLFLHAEIRIACDIFPFGIYSLISSANNLFDDGPIIGMC